MVLWFISLLTVLALGFSQTMRNDTRITANLLEALRARQLAEAAIQHAIYDLVNQETEMADAVISGNAVSFEFAGVEVSYRIEDENGKVDINQAPPELFTSLLISQEVGDEQAKVLSDQLLDWRDENDLRLLDGAEAPEYLAAGRTRLPANAPFRSIGELQQLLGMEPGLYARLAPLVTVHGNNDKINPEYAPEGVLKALPGVDPGELEEFINYRKTLSPEIISPAFPELTGVESWLDDESGPVYTVYGTAALPSGAFASRRTIVWIHSFGDRTHYVLESTDNILRPKPGEQSE